VFENILGMNGGRQTTGQGIIRKLVECEELMQNKKKKKKKKKKKMMMKKKKKKKKKKTSLPRQAPYFISSSLFH
jgi:hypothetical protein